MEGYDIFWNSTKVVRTPLSSAVYNRKFRLRTGESLLHPLKQRSLFLDLFILPSLFAIADNEKAILDSSYKYPS
jgi:hypothetical protein